MKWIWIVGLLLGLAGIIGVRSWWFRAEGEADHIPAAVPGEPIENFLPTGPATRPVLRVNPLVRVNMSADYRRRSFKTAIDDIASAANVSIVPDWKTITDAGVEPTTPVPLRIVAGPASAVLESVLRQAGGGNVRLIYWVDADQIVRISTDARSPQVLRLYNVRDILADSARFHRALATLPNSTEEERRNLLNLDDIIKNLKELIMEEVDRESWIDNGGKCGTWHYVGGKMFITQTEENHAKIDDILAKLRQK